MGNTGRYEIEVLPNLVCAVAPVVKVGIMFKILDANRIISNPFFFNYASKLF